MTPAFDAIVLAGGRASRLGGTPKPGLLLDDRPLLAHALDAVRDAEAVAVVGPEDLDVPAGVRLTREEPPFGGPVAGIDAGLHALDRPGAPSVVVLLAVDVPGAAPMIPQLVRALSSDQPSVLGPATPLRSAQDDRSGVDRSDGFVAQPDDGLEAGQADLAGFAGPPPVILREVAGSRPSPAPPRPGAPIDGACLFRDGHRQTLVSAVRRASLVDALDALRARAGSVRDQSVRRLVAGLRLVDVPDDVGASSDVDTWEDLARLQAARTGRTT